MKKLSYLFVGALAAKMADLFWPTIMAAATGLWEWIIRYPKETSRGFAIIAFASVVGVAALSYFRFRRGQSIERGGISLLGPIYPLDPPRFRPEPPVSAGKSFGSRQS